MDKVRIALFAAIAMLSFMLVVEFAEFRDSKSKAKLLAGQESSAITQTIASSLPAANTVDNDSEIPVAIQTTIPQIETVVSTSLITIETDTLLVKLNPLGGDIVYVALTQQLARIDTPDIPFVLLNESNDKTYIAASGLIGINGTDTAKGRPLFSTAHANYQLGDGDNELIVDLTLQQDQVSIVKRFTFKRDTYLVDVDYLINNQSTDDWQAAFYAQIKRDSKPDPAAESGGMGMQPYLGFATRTQEERFLKIDFDDVADKAFPETTVEGGWIAMIQHYFLSAWVASPDQENTFSTIRTKSGFNIARVKSPVSIVKAGEQGTIHNSFYAGPKDQYTLETISEGLDLSVDYGFLWMIAQPLYALLHMFNEGVLHIFGSTFDFGFGLHNWGFSIIALTIFVKACFFSLNAKAYKSMAKMRAIQPKMLALKERHGDDKQKMSQETMALYKNEGVNPLGGCLPMVVQMPVFISLYWVLLESVELRHAPFIGYIHDLSAMDPYFIMPLIMGVSMFFQQKLNPPPPDPMQAKIMQFLPVIFTFFFLFFPSGLVLYWVVNNVLTIIQQYIITKRIEKEMS